MHLDCIVGSVKAPRQNISIVSTWMELLCRILLNLAPPSQSDEGSHERKCEPLPKPSTLVAELLLGTTHPVTLFRQCTQISLNNKPRRVPTPPIKVSKNGNADEQLAAFRTKLEISRKRTNAIYFISTAI
jgi:hypothetical protein